MSEAEVIDMCLYDSDTQESLEPLHVEDVSEFQNRDEKVQLVYTRAVRGPIVQVQSDGSRIHYFYREAGSRRMIEEDEGRLGFHPGELLALVDRFAPPPKRDLTWTKQLDGRGRWRRG